MKSDIWKIIGILVFACVLGWTMDAPMLLLVGGCLGIIVWQIYRFERLRRWINNPKKRHLAETSGQAFELYRLLTRKNNQNTQRKRRLSALLGQFRRAVAALPDAIILIDSFGKIIWANSNARQIVGVRWPEDVGVRFSDLLRHPDLEKVLPVNGALSEQAAQGVEIQPYNNKDQTLSFKLVEYTDGRFMVIARDVSRLIQVNQIHSDFVANVSHELKTPLTVLRGYLEILQDKDDLPPTLATPLREMNQQAHRMYLIVQDLLLLARLENPESFPEMHPINVAQLIEQVLDAVTPLLNEKQHQITLDIQYSAHLIGASSEIQSAFTNLIVNAIHYTESNGQISLQWQETETGAAFRVIDNGVGIPTVHLDKLTIRFYRVDTDRSREGGGTGLGLAIVKHVLHRHQAELQIESTEGVGSIFSCHFPQSQLHHTGKSQLKLVV